jgi:hypothetical protein
MGLGIKNSGAEDPLPSAVCHLPSVVWGLGRLLDPAEEMGAEEEENRMADDG